METQSNFIDHQNRESEMSCFADFATFEDFTKEIHRIVSVSDQMEIPLRVSGGATIRMHRPKHELLYEQLKRTPKHDMNGVTYSKFRAFTKKLFIDLRYEPYISLMLTGATGRHRQILNDKEGNNAINSLSHQTLHAKP